MQLNLPEYAGCLFEPCRYKVLYGGRGGAKSWAIAMALLTLGMNKPIRVLCARELQVSIADSVHKLLSDVIYNSEMQHFYEVQNKVILGKNGTEFAFKGLKHNANEIKSYEGVDYVWVEEAQAVSDKSWEVLIPTIRKDGSEIWICFNPKNATDPTYQRFVLNKRDNSVVKKVGWQDNPFFPKVLDEERLHLLKTDPDAYKHVWEGEFDTRYSGAVYASWLVQEQVSDMVKHDPAYPVYTSRDLGWGDATSIVFFQIGIGEIFIIDYYESNQKDSKHFCEIMAGKQIIVNERDLDTGDVLNWRYGETLEAHAHRQEYTYAKHYAPHDAAYKVQAAGGRSILEQSKKFGVDMVVYPATAHINNQDALRATLPRCWINQDRCQDLIHALISYHFEYDEDKKDYKKEPYHDWSSHACDAMELMARAWRENVVTTKDMAQQAQVNKFHRLRAENKLDSGDPYRIKPMRKV